MYPTDHGSCKYITKVNQVQYILLPFLVKTCRNWNVKEHSPLKMLVQVSKSDL